MNILYFPNVNCSDNARYLIKNYKIFDQSDMLRHVPTDGVLQL